MELSAYPKTDYLLNSSLASLHNQSLEWLNDLEFWQDEMAFFYKLLHSKNTKKEVPIEKLEELGSYLNMNTEKLEKHRNAILAHENFLASIMRGSSFKEEENYRKIHRSLFKTVYEDQLMVMNYKINLFSLFIDSK